MLFYTVSSGTPEHIIYAGNGFLSDIGSTYSGGTLYILCCNAPCAKHLGLTDGFIYHVDHVALGFRFAHTAR